MENAPLEWASDMIEEAGVPAGREANWALQRRHQAEWMVPALEALADLPQWHSSTALVDRHTRLYSPGEVTGLLKAAGFRGITQRRNGAPRYHWRATV